VPPEVVVSICSCTRLNPLPLLLRSRTVSTRCGSDHPRRSSFHTTNVSPVRHQTHSYDMGSVPRSVKLVQRVPDVAYARHNFWWRGQIDDGCAACKRYSPPSYASRSSRVAQNPYHMSESLRHSHSVTKGGSLLTETAILSSP
jgi:hypothetical protein